MAHIYIGFSSPNKFKIGAEAIKFWTGANYSHAYVRFVSNHDEIPSTVYQASHGMVHFRSFDKFQEDNKIIHEVCLLCDDKTKLKVLAHCMQLSGESYGYIELVTILLSDIANSFNIKLATKDGHGYICSELVGTLLTQHFDIKFNKPCHLLKPTDIYKALEY